MLFRLVSAVAVSLQLPHLGFSSLRLSAVIRVQPVVIFFIYCLIGSSACSSTSQVPRLNGEVSELGRKVPSSALSWYLRGLHLEGAGSIAAAKVAYQQASKHDPRAGSPKAAYGRLLCVDNPQEGIVYLDKALQKTEEKSPLLLELAVCSLKQGHGEEAEQFARRAILLDPNSEDASVALARALILQEQHEKARLILAAFEQLTGPQMTAHRAIKPSEARTPVALATLLRNENYRQAEDLSLETSSFGSLACKAYQLGKVKYALSLAQLLAAAQPGSVDAWAIQTVEELRRSSRVDPSAISSWAAAQQKFLQAQGLQSMAKSCSALLLDLGRILEQAQQENTSYFEPEGNLN